MRNADEIMLLCDCKDRFTIEPHGEGLTLYYGRCDHKHGYNLGEIREPSYNALSVLNGPIEERDLIRASYNELIYEVVNKVDDETRHDTAKRIIRQHESSNDDQAKASTE
jgi:hypothetical protein